MGEVLALTDRLEAELPAMLEEHKAIVAALAKWQEAAQRAGCSEWPGGPWAAGGQRVEWRNLQRGRCRAGIAIAVSIDRVRRG